MKKKYEKKEERKDRRDKRGNKTSFRGKEREKGSRIRKEKSSNHEEEQVKSISDNMYDFTGETEKQSYIYGRNAVAELLKSGQTINKVWISKEARGNDLEKIIRELKEERIVYIFVDKEKLDTIQENNQGIIASINPFEYVEIDEILKEKEIRNEDSFILVLDKIEDTHNLGAIIRVAEAAGVHGIIIPKRNAAGVTPLTIKTSAGAVSHIKIARVTNIVQTLKELKEKGMWVVGTDLETNNMYTKTNLTGDMAVVIGNEEKGISRLVKEECDILVKIPMIGKVQSLNASVSAGIIIYEIVRQRLEKKQ